MSGFWIVAAVTALGAFLVVWAFVRAFWRVGRGDEELQPAGSYGKLFRRSKPPAES